MKETINLHQFRRAFEDYDRKNNFTYEGLEALFEYLAGFRQIELDVIALCCEYTEYKGLDEFNREYEPVESIDEIEERTTVIRLGNGGGFIIRNY